MKYILVLFLLSISCNKKEENKYLIITAKSYMTFMNNSLPKGICRYLANIQEFQDSCKYYQVGDTIGVTKIRK